jgi:hypothetical protein
MLADYGFTIDENPHDKRLLKFSKRLICAARDMAGMAKVRTSYLASAFLIALLSS